MNYLLDTCALIDIVFTPERLSAVAREAVSEGSLQILNYSIREGFCQSRKPLFVFYTGDCYARTVPGVTLKFNNPKRLQNGLLGTEGKERYSTGL